MSIHYPKVLERVDSPEQIFHRSFSLGAPVSLVVIGNNNCLNGIDILDDDEGKNDVRICLPCNKVEAFPMSSTLSWFMLSEKHSFPSNVCYS